MRFHLNRRLAATFALCLLFLIGALTSDAGAQTRRHRSTRSKPTRRTTRRPAAKPTPAPVLSLVLAPEVPRVGGTMFVSIALPGGKLPRSAVITFDGTAVPTYRSTSGFRAAVPLGLESDDGTHPLVVTATDSSGKVHTVRRSVTVLRAITGTAETIRRPAAKYARLSERERVVADQKATLAKLRVRTPEQLWRGNFQPPIQPNKSQGFGAERLYQKIGDPEAVKGDTSRDDSRHHKGVDYAAPAGSAAHAVASGIVIDVHRYILTGTTVLVNHGQGIATLYAHLDTAKVRVGDRVRVGQTVGLVGQTGLSTGPHLHLGLYIGGEAVDPRPWFSLPSFMKTSPAPVQAAVAPSSGELGTAAAFTAVLRDRLAQRGLRATVLSQKTDAGATDLVVRFQSAGDSAAFGRAAYVAVHEAADLLQTATFPSRQLRIEAAGFGYAATLPTAEAKRLSGDEAALDKAVTFDPSGR